MNDATNTDTITRPKPTNDAMRVFDRWYSRDGHWIYTRERALDVWRTRGIDGIPPFNKVGRRPA